MGLSRGFEKMEQFRQRFATQQEEKLELIVQNSEQSSHE
jgi:hypothetical protein